MRKAVRKAVIRLKKKQTKKQNNNKNKAKTEQNKTKQNKATGGSINQFPRKGLQKAVEGEILRSPVKLYVGSQIVSCIVSSQTVYHLVS